MHRTTLLLIALLGLLGPMSVTASGADAAWPPDPCELLDDALIQDVFDLGGDVRLVRLPDSRSPQPLCRVRWVRADLAALQAEHERLQQDHVREMATATRRKNDPPKPPRVETHHEVALALTTRRFGSAAEAAAGFHRELDDLAAGRGPSGRSRGAAPLTGIDRDVAGAGDEAAWTPGLRRLSVLSGRRVFHVTVNVHDSDTVNRDRAITIARRIIERF